LRSAAPALLTGWLEQHGSPLNVLAANVVVGSGGRATLDPIDALKGS
jgi:hypothetical protein